MSKQLRVRSPGMSTYKGSEIWNKPISGTFWAVKLIGKGKDVWSHAKTIIL